jgi:hypothetical protein
MTDNFRRQYEDVRAAQRVGRQIAAEGVLWLVYELSPTRFDRRSGPSLVFASDRAMRRVRTFPADWRSLSDEALYALEWSQWVARLPRRS